MISMIFLHPWGSMPIKASTRKSEPRRALYENATNLSLIHISLRREILTLAEEKGIPLWWVRRDTTVELEKGQLTLYPPLGAGEANELGLSVLAGAGGLDPVSYTHLDVLQISCRGMFYRYRRPGKGYRKKGGRNDEEGYI